MGECRRCSECIGAKHHWLQPDSFIPIQFAGCDQDPEVEDILILQLCKHCDAVKVWDEDGDDG